MPLNGSATSSPPDTSRPATLTSGQLSMFDPPTLPATASAISSLASADGPSPCVSPDGPMTDLFGPVPVPANPSAPPARARRAMTSATCGLRGFLSSASYALQSSLESRLRRQLDGAGSTLFSLTWKRKATPAGRPYFQLAASGRPISDSGFGSLAHWSSPQAEEASESPMTKDARNKRLRAAGKAKGCGSYRLGTQAQLASWATPRSTEAGHSSGNPARALDGRSRLEDQVFMASWPTPTHGDGASTGAAGYSTESGRHSGTMLTDAARAAWPTARATDGEKNVRTAGGAAREMERKGGPQDLNQAATLASWATPTANEKVRIEEFMAGRQLNAREALGPTSNGSPAATGKRGQLNPAFSRWLMGYSAEHLSCAPTAMPSRRNAPPNLSEQQCEWGGHESSGHHS
jgi:hypothetical protein